MPEIFIKIVKHLTNMCLALYVIKHFSKIDPYNNPMILAWWYLI